MIEVYTGFVGSGKSYHAVKRGIEVAEAWFGNRWVVANFPISRRKKFVARIPVLGRFVKDPFVESRWIYISNDELKPDCLVKLAYEKGFHKKEGSCLLIIDEAGILFNSRDWNVKGNERKEWIQFFSQSRKLGYDVVFIVQDIRMLDRQIRNLCEYEVQHKKLNHLGLLNVIPIFWFCTIFAAVRFWNGIRTMRGSLELFVFRKSIADRYDTKALFGYDKKFLAGGEGGPVLTGGSLPPAKMEIKPTGAGE